METVSVIDDGDWKGLLSACWH